MHAYKSMKSEVKKLAELFLKWLTTIAQLVRNQPAMQEMPVWFLGWEDPLEKEISIHSSILAWRIPGTIQSMG